MARNSEIITNKATPLDKKGGLYVIEPKKKPLIGFLSTFILPYVQGARVIPHRANIAPHGYTAVDGKSRRGTMVIVHVNWDTGVILECKRTQWHEYEDSELSIPFDIATRLAGGILIILKRHDKKAYAKAMKMLKEGKLFL